MQYLGSSAVPASVLSISSVFVAIATILLFFTLYEFYVLTRLESELTLKANKNESKRRALSSIRGEGEEKNKSLDK